ncbi:MAG TPA: L,D-transpeptidase [Pseudolabrys sp.]|jgi:hypothetical protein
MLAHRTPCAGRFEGQVMRCIGVVVFCALLCLAAPAKADVLVSINKSQQQMTVSIDGARTYHWAVSTGRSGYDTPSGGFRAIRLERVYYSKKFDDAPMPNSVFFYGGYAIHGTYEESKLGNPVSHGCVRLARVNAETLYALVRARGMSNTRVVISDGPLRDWPGPGPMARAQSRVRTIRHVRAARHPVGAAPCHSELRNAAPPPRQRARSIARRTVIARGLAAQPRPQIRYQHAVAARSTAIVVKS